VGHIVIPLPSTGASLLDQCEAIIAQLDYLAGTLVRYKDEDQAAHVVSAAITIEGVLRSLKT
jgi:hypothetical protein